LSNAKKMAQLIDDLLAFSRLGKKELQRTVIDMNDLFDECIDELKKITPSYHASILKKEMDHVNADYNLAKQVILNLLGNALKYSHTNPQPLIEIGSFHEKGVTVFYVKDNGVGFDMQYYGKLFGVFQRLHTDQEFEGTGVGLALVYRIITRHGGKVWAESEPDKGATFYFSFDTMI
jgi:light-regulated signal transduction histidine kinase (bacteriophytochrome)